MTRMLPMREPDFIENLIPQKPPFVMVSGILSHKKNHLISEFIIPQQHIFVHQGFFQESGLLEHQAQSVALYTGLCYFLQDKEIPAGYIGSVTSFQVEKLPKTGDILESEVKILHQISGISSVEITSRISGEMIAKSIMKTVLL